MIFCYISHTHPSMAITPLSIDISLSFFQRSSIYYFPQSTYVAFIEHIISIFINEETETQHGFLITMLNNNNNKNVLV